MSLDDLKPQVGDTDSGLLYKIAGLLYRQQHCPASAQIIFGEFTDPNGHVTPGDKQKAALYYKDSDTLQMWKWSVAGQNWTAIVTT